MVRDAGLDVSDWEASKGGAKSAAANPKYCYNWSFVDDGKKLVLLNLWHSNMAEQADVVTCQWNARDIAEKSRGVTVRRAMAMDRAIQDASQNSLFIRVVVCQGTQKNLNDRKSSASKVLYRLLDPEPWHVAQYDETTGQCTLMRGLGDNSDKFMDQFDISVPLGGPAEKVIVNNSHFIRRPEIRRRALQRAEGKCQHCDKEGFKMQNGKVYLETHHVQPLHEDGEDSLDNVVALCPDHHREVHHGKKQAEIRQRLIKLLATFKK
jgi:5-methylcytosine-specific restriction protein A